MPSAVRGDTLGQKPLSEERGERERDVVVSERETDEEEVRVRWVVRALRRLGERSSASRLP